MNFENSSNKIVTDTLVGLNKSHILKRVLSSEKLTVGVSAGIKGLSWCNQAGFYEGFDIDLAKAISAAIFCDDGKCKFIAVNPTKRFEAINSGKIDIGLFNASKTLQRELSGDVVFPIVTLIDGEGVLVRKNDMERDFKNWADPTIGVQSGTTSKQNIRSYRGNNYNKFQEFTTITEAVEALKKHQIDGVVFDTIGLAGIKVEMDEENNLHILPEKISRELLGPVVSIEDPIFSRLVSWVFHRLVLSADVGLSKENIENAEFNSAASEVLENGLALFEGDIHARKRLHTILNLVGNYQDIFERNLGAASALNLPAGYNASTSEGGIYHAPPV